MIRMRVQVDTRPSLQALVRGLDALAWCYRASRGASQALSLGKAAEALQGPLFLGRRIAGISSRRGPGSAPRRDRVSRQAGPARDLADRQPVPQPHPADLRVHCRGVHLSSLPASSPAGRSEHPGQFSADRTSISWSVFNGRQHPGGAHSAVAQHADSMGWLSATSVEWPIDVDESACRTPEDDYRGQTNRRLESRAR